MMLPLKISLELELAFLDLEIKINIIMYCDVYFSIDASEEDLTVGRLINDSMYLPNARMRKIVSTSRRRPYICLFAVRDIDISEESLYFYCLENLPWHEQVSETN